MINNNSLKEYYVKIQELYTNAVNLLTAINQSLTTSSGEVTVNLVTNDESSASVKIPSFLYLENKLEQIGTNFDSLFNLPESGEAWFSKSSDMYKLQLVRSNTAPVKPIISSNETYASITDNNILKDMVSPKTYLKLNITNLPDNIEQMFMRKLVIYSASNYNYLSSIADTLDTYDKYEAALYNLTKGTDYEEYDSVIDLPIKKDVYASEFQILEIPELDNGNPWTDSDKLNYKLVLNTLTYTNQEDSSIEYTLQPGDYICLSDQLAIYKIKNVSYSDNSVIIEENVGHITLQTYEENTSMIMYLYNEDYSAYHYVQVPLEENPYIIIFLGTIYNNTRSLLSAPYMVNLNEIYMKDASGNDMLDSAGNKISYIDYYNKYCVNIGDLILGLTEAAYPQLSNFDNSQLNTLENGVAIQELVSKSIDNENILKVVAINKHLIDDSTSENLINYHTQKNEINAQLSSLQSNIDTVYNTLITTDFTQEVTVTQMSLRSQLTEYYNQRTILQKQLINVVDSINTLSTDVPKDTSSTKYRIRGITNVEDVELLAQEYTSSNVHIIGCDVEYKYKSTTKDTTTLNTINSKVFTNWNKYTNIERERYLQFNSTVSGWELAYENYGDTTNIIKWNQIDIPIQQGEDVIVRVRYKYNIGQPFINLYTPWSDELTVEFPAEYEENVEITSILDTNNDDTVTAKFLNTLINEGYQEHITNSITANNTTFYHMPENIYSGFTTSENNLISLKDKLTSMASDIESYKQLIDAEINKKFAIYLQYDNNNVELFNNTTNKINIYNSEHIVESFIRKDMNIVIKNTGDTVIKLYSIFPGAIDIPLLLSSNEFYDKSIGNYERVPMIIDDAISYQTLGQWIYFREKNPYTGKSVYYNTTTQNNNDFAVVSNNTANSLSFNAVPTNYMGVDNAQVLLGYRKRDNGVTATITNYWQGITYDPVANVYNVEITDKLNETISIFEKYKTKDIDFFMYKNDENIQENFLVRYEDITGKKENNTKVNLDSSISLINFMNTYNSIFSNASDSSIFNGAFLYPNITGRTTILTNGQTESCMEIPVGETLSVPITFEYYLDGTNLDKITKSLYFDIRDSLTSDPKHYLLEVTAVYDYTVAGDMLNNTDYYLSDEVSDI